MGLFRVRVGGGLVGQCRSQRFWTLSETWLVVPLSGRLELVPDSAGFAEIRCLNAEVLRSSVGANEIVVMVEVSTITTGLIEILSDLDSLAESQGPLPA
jgi:hypothetical protein